jgi:ATP-dependent Clp protease ATP-binding subunit ClpX
VAEESDNSKITREQALEALLLLGHALHRYANPKSILGLPRPIKQDEAEGLLAQIAELTCRVEKAACNPTHRSLRSVLKVRRDEIPDAMEIRIVAYVAWHSLASETGGASVTKVANAVGLGSMKEMIKARHSIRQMLIGGDVLVFKDGEEILMGWKMIRLCSGDNRLPILWTEETLKREAEEGLRQKAAHAQKPTSSHRHAEPPPSAQKSEDSQNLLTARGISNLLKDEVIALDAPLLRFSAQMSLHMRRLEQIRKGVRPSVGPIVTLLIGSSGSGKTWMAENFARISGLPYAVADMSCVSQTSYVGLGLDECFLGLLANKTKPQIAETGILVMDEFDKICAKGNGGHSSADAQGRGIQSEILKPWDGCRLPLGSRRSNVPSLGVIDTFHTCFVACGAFQGLRGQLEEGYRKAAGLGFCSAESKRLRSGIREALVKYGFMEQIVNRIGAIIVLPDPTPDQIVRITSHPGSGLLARWHSFANSFGMSIDMTDEAIQYLAHWACETRGYSRAVKTVLGTLVESHLYDDKADIITVWRADIKKAIEETEGAEGLLQ